MPFAGDAAAAGEALTALRSLEVRDGDELLLADNSGTAASAIPGVRIVRAVAEHSPAHARNVGAEAARGEWILFLDSDCLPPAGLLDAYFAQPVADDVGALAGEVRPAPGAETLAGRYGAQKSFLSQEAHLAHPFRPRAVAANLLVRREAFTQIGGFFEGVRAAEDTDFSWRLQEAGWRLELRPEAAVEHRYRTSLADLRRQWRGYAAGRAWLARRYTGFVPEPAARRAIRRVPALVWTRGHAPVEAGAEAVGAPSTLPVLRDRAGGVGRLERGRYLLLDVLLSAEELAGLALSNRPRASMDGRPVQAFLIAERFPALGDPLVELARTLGRVRVQAAARPRQADMRAARELAIDYREDDGAAARMVAAFALVVRHPLRCVRDRLLRGGEPGLSALAPTVRRIQRAPHARVLALGSGQVRLVAERVAALAGRTLDDAPRRGRDDGLRRGRDDGSRRGRDDGSRRGRWGGHGDADA
jgi:GT2 family glycosyltransferase